MADEAVAEMLTRVRGVGPWTAHMFLMFSLHRLDVWPVGDFGVRTGYARAWALAEAPTPRQLDALGERFRPYRSVVAWYCWRAVDGSPQA
jgi:DNA-3-methyladenine glycosylase II